MPWRRSAAKRREWTKIYQQILRATLFIANNIGQIGGAARSRTGLGGFAIQHAHHALRRKPRQYWATGRAYSAPVRLFAWVCPISYLTGARTNCAIALPSRHRSCARRLGRRCGFGQRSLPTLPKLRQTLQTARRADRGDRHLADPGLIRERRDGRRSDDGR